MPSSYNNNLRLEMIATGEQSGTWGQTTNTNLGTLLVDAITGKTSITSSSSPYTLTALNGTADQSRAAALELNCTGANFEVIVPTVTKLYVVENVNATDSVEVKTASGNGVTVPPLKTVLLRCDGTDVVEQLDYVVGNFGVGGNVSVTGTTTLLDDLILNSSSGTSGQVVVSQGAGNPPVWGNAFVTGMIMMWSGTIATIPSGWALCNGSGGTPDLRNRFIIGAHSDDAGAAKTTITGSPTQTGGSKDSIVVSHNHTATSSVTDPGHLHTYNQTIVGNQFVGTDTAGNFARTSVNTSSAVTGISVSTSVASSGSSGTDANLVPYYALAFIMKL